MMHLIYLSIILIIITIVSGFYLSRYKFLKSENDSDTRKILYESIYKYGVIVGVEITTKSKRLITILEIIDSLISRVNAHQRQLSYVFTANDGKLYSGAGTVYFFLEPWIFISTAGSKIKVIYKLDDPSVNLIYTDIKNKKYNQKEITMTNFS